MTTENDSKKRGEGKDVRKLPSFRRRINRGKRLARTGFEKDYLSENDSLITLGLYEVGAVSDCPLQMAAVIATMENLRGFKADRAFEYLSHVLSRRAEVGVDGQGKFAAIYKAMLKWSRIMEVPTIELKKTRNGWRAEDPEKAVQRLFLFAYLYPEYGAAQLVKDFAAAGLEAYGQIDALRAAMQNKVHEREDGEGGQKIQTLEAEQAQILLQLAEFVHQPVQLMGESYEDVAVRLLEFIPQHPKDDVKATYPEWRDEYLKPLGLVPEDYTPKGDEDEATGDEVEEDGEDDEREAS